MSGVDVSQEVRAEVARALAELRPQLAGFARADADLDPASQVEAFSDADLDQLINAWEALFLEALNGTGTQTRELIFDTALPPILENRTVLDMTRSNIISAVMLAHRLLPLVAAEHREDAARWLASFHGEYAFELFERALQLKGQGE